MLNREWSPFRAITEWHRQVRLQIAQKAASIISSQDFVLQVILYGSVAYPEFAVEVQH